MVFLYVNKQYLLLVDAIGRYSDRLGPRPKMRSVAYRMRCVYATAEVICKIISHNNENPTTTMTMNIVGARKEDFIANTLPNRMVLNNKFIAYLYVTTTVKDGLR
uniref:Uncharacterized protein n=1 Tax=Glossina austeni TaxID=7395 RepID=A0A1A9UWZ2_GLOAU